MSNASIGDQQSREATADLGSRDLSRSVVALAVFPLTLIVGFILGAGAMTDYTMDKTLAISPLNVGIAIVGLIVAAAPPIAGFGWAARAVRDGQSLGWIPVLLNALAVLLVAAMIVGSVQQVMNGR